MRPWTALTALTLALALALVTPSPADANEPDNGEGHRLAARVVAPDIAISNVVHTGGAGSAQRFDDVPQLGLHEGILLSTGHSSGASRRPGDADLTDLLHAARLGRTTKEAATLEFDLVPTATLLTFRFAFASDESPTTGQPDVFGLWIDGHNIAVTAEGEPITARTALRDSHARDGIDYAAVSEVRTAQATVEPGQSVHVKIAIADATHDNRDSAVYLEANNRTALAGESLLQEDFEAGLANWEFPRLPLALVDDGEGNALLTTDPATPKMQRGVIGSPEWDNYTLRARVRSTEFTKAGSWVSLLGRYIDDNNYYQVQMMGHEANRTVTIRRRAEGTNAYLAQRSDWSAPTGEWVDMELVLSGALIEFYVDGQLVISARDYALTHGAPGVAADLGSDIQFDDLAVTAIPNPAIAARSAAVPAGTYYVSPSGDDDNPGSELLPWRSVAKAAEVAQAGTTVLFEDGTYDETQITTFTNSGTENDRIVFRSRNPRGAKIVYHGLPNSKLSIIDRAYITVQGFEITQDVPGTTTADILIEIRTGAHHVHVIGNHLHGAFEEGVKGYLVNGMVVEGNLIEDMDHEAIDFVNVDDSTIRGNEIREIGRVGILAKGGSTDITIVNNTVTALEHPMALGAIYIGGVTDGVSTKDATINGFEAWNVVVYNNVIRGALIAGTDTIPNAIAFQGAKDSTAVHNVIADVRAAFYLRPGGHLPSGWAWEPNNVNITFANNIVTDVAAGHVNTGGATPVNLVHDYNLYHEARVSTPVETHGVYADPQFVAAGSNWRLAATSPARNAAPCIPGFTRHDGTVLSIINDIEGNPRTGTVCSLGVYR